MIHVQPRLVEVGWLWMWLTVSIPGTVQYQANEWLSPQRSHPDLASCIVTKPAGTSPACLFSLSRSLSQTSLLLFFLVILALTLLLPGRGLPTILASLLFRSWLSFFYLSVCLSCTGCDSPLVSLEQFHSFAPAFLDAPGCRVPDSSPRPLDLRSIRGNRLDPRRNLTFSFGQAPFTPSYPTVSGIAT